MPDKPVMRPRGRAPAPTNSAQARAQGPKFLLTHEVAAIFQVAPKTVSRWAKAGKLPFRRTMGGHRRYPDAEIRELARQYGLWGSTE